MKKVEKWRVEEMSLLLTWLATLLNEGRNPEWAAVFSHFDQESRLLLAEELIDPAKLARLIGNIKACFVAPCSFPDLILKTDHLANESALNAEFLRVKVRLCRALEDMEATLVEYIN